jgi:hypothetical protein
VVNDGIENEASVEYELVSYQVGGFDGNVVNDHQVSV